MNLPEMRQGFLETEGGGGAKTLAHYGTNKKPEGGFETWQKKPQLSFTNL